MLDENGHNNDQTVLLHRINLQIKLTLDASTLLTIRDTCSLYNNVYKSTM